jgi:hypothetical protein
VSIKEKAVVSVLGLIALYVGAACFWFMSQEREWKKAAREYERAVKTYNDQTELISQRREWMGRYEDEKSKIATFEKGTDTDTTWQRKMNEIAARHNVFISSSQAGKAVVGEEVEELEELEIEVKTWEGSLESLVKFMYELETTSDGMFDLKSLNFKPSPKSGYMKGNFVLTCAYMRGQKD